MPSLNRVFLMGNLTRDPELKYTQSGLAVCDFGLAVNRKYKTGGGEDREEVLFVDVSAFGKQAETASEYLRKGRGVLVEGRLKLDQWEKDGQKRSKHTVVADRVHFLGGKGTQDAAADDSGGAGPGQGHSDECPF